MPIGVYERTESHIAICSKGGKANAKKHPRTYITYTCLECGATSQYMKGDPKKFCSRRCANLSMTNKNPKTYGAIHAYVRRTFGTPSECEHCGRNNSKKFEWANISGEYTLDRSDWARLCCQCHRRYDCGTKNKIEVLNV